MMTFMAWIVAALAMVSFLGENYEAAQVQLLLAVFLMENRRA